MRLLLPVPLGLLLSVTASVAGESQLTTGVSDQRPAWSPDGATIAFDSNRSGNRDVWSVAAGGGVPVQLTTATGTEQDPDWSPTSTTLVLSSDGDLHTLPAAGGTPTLLHASATNDRFPAWSPDGSLVAYSNGDLWVIPSSGGAPVPLTSGPDNDAHPSWSPDGTRIAFHSNRSGNNDVWVIPSAGGTPTPVTSDAANDAAPDWSPDGSRIAFQSNRAGNNDIWVIAADGGPTFQVTTFAGNDVQPEWGPDGAIVWARGNDLWRFEFDRSDLGVENTVDPAEPFEGDTVVFTVAVRNDGPDDAILVVVDHLLPEGLAYESHTVTRGAYSPLAGTWDVGDLAAGGADTLAITASVAAGTAGTTLASAATVASIANDDPDDTDDSSTASVAVQIQLEVTEKALTSQGTDRHPAWSRDGRTVVFDSERSGSQGLWSIPAAGGVAAPLPTGLASAGEPDWSPGSATLVLAGTAGRGAGTGLYTLPVAGGGTGSAATPSPLLPVGAAGGAPAWSPDGAKVAYSDGSDVFTVPSIGGSPTRITVDPAADVHPTWSPDGSSLAFVSARGGGPDVWVIAAAGGPATRITDHPAADDSPDWSPDGEWIAFQSDRAGSHDIWIVPSSGGAPRRVTSGPADDTEPDWAPDGRGIVFSRDGGLRVAAIPDLPPPRPTSAPALASPTARIRSVAPNPGRAPRIVWDAGRAGPCELAVYDVAGRLVRRLVTGAATPGTHVTVWEARVPSGAYFVSLEAAGRRDTAKVLILR